MIRYSDEELESLLDDIESDLAERKESWKGDAPENGRQAVCAFSNDLPDHRRPGVLFVGAKNVGTPSGLPITDELLRTLAGFDPSWLRNAVDEPLDEADIERITEE